MNTKSHGGKIFLKNLSMVGSKIYPSEDLFILIHYKLKKYNIGVHRGSLLLDPKKVIYKSKKEMKLISNTFVCEIQKCHKGDIEILLFSISCRYAGLNKFINVQ